MTSDRPTYRVGWGFDAHRLDGEPPLILGGVVVSDTDGVSATSDGDLLAHAVSDAILGACALGDIGELFPSEDEGSSGADSMGLLRSVLVVAADAGWRPSHVDVTVVSESVRVAPHRNAIVAGLAEALGLPEGAVSVKATTTDGLGFIGREEGLAAVAVMTVTPLS